MESRFQISSIYLKFNSILEIVLRHITNSGGNNNWIIIETF